VEAVDLCRFHRPDSEVPYADAVGGVSPQRVCLAWMLAKAPVVVPIPGSSRPGTARDSAAAADLAPDEAELARLDRA
jgi:aryl-alcohol dehydrogenase-like predicted oxidoreductase